MIALPIIDTPTAGAGERAWRSIPHLNQDSEHAEVNSEEFFPGASEGPKNSSRRHFMQILGASMAMAGLAACRKPVETIMPFADRPEELIPGIPLHYATAMPFRGSVEPLLVRSNDGRPTKIEANSQHATAGMGTSVFAQASILNLYDPDRSKQVLRAENTASWDDFFALCQRINSGDRRIVVLSRESSSPTLLSLRETLLQSHSNASWMTYRPEGADNESEGIAKAFGQRLRPMYHFDQAQVIVSLDSDFLGPTARNGSYSGSSFAESRRLSSGSSDMSRLYVLESTYSTTGAMADHRYRMQASSFGSLANSIASELGVIGDEFASPNETARIIAADLRRAGAQGLIVAGDHLPAEVHALCAAMNSQLGAIGSTVTLLDTEVPHTEADLAAITQEMQSGEVDVLLMLDVNPVYDAPPELNFAEALKRVGDSIHVGPHVDETARASSWHIPLAHYLEAWGDGRSYDGTLSVQQPLIAPLYPDAKSHLEILHALATGTEGVGYDLVRTTWEPVLGTPFESRWREVLHNGYLEDSGFASVVPATLPVSAASSGQENMEVVFRLDPTVLDGSFANNAWCQELPDPVTKIVWDNVAIVSPATAEALGVTAQYIRGRYEADVITLSAGGQSVDLPIWVLQGHADNSISVNLGYGRDILSNREHRDTPPWDVGEKVDIYGQGSLGSGIGQNVSLLRDANSAAIRGSVTVTPTGEKYRIVTTQDHGTLDVSARPFVRSATLDEYRSNPDFALDYEIPTPGSDEKTRFEDYPTLWENNHPDKEPAFKDSNYYRNQWGMVIDLNTCSGCSACIVACQSENNIQVVGKTEVGNGRELHWLRMDRYFITSDEGAVTDDPQMAFQPMPCQHCENAPCESVCPVAATVHSPDGTNQMIYNRCIGTRYCANNCPYKVRRFNFFSWSRYIPPTVQMAQNPNVTIRSRGVMEKCSFCIQRIRGTQKQARLEGRELYRDEVKTACQQACSSDSIIFGDLNDSESRVSTEFKDPRRYTMLAELNVRPRVSYLARVRNPNSELETA